MAAYRTDATQDAAHHPQASGRPCESKKQAISPLPIPTVLGEAKRLYEAGFNTFPIPVVGMECGGRKPPFGKTSVLITTRLAVGSFLRLFQDANLAVMTGRLSDNLFVLDGDSRAAFEFVRDGLAERGIRAWVRSSVRGGQFWMRCADGEIENAKPRPDLDVIGTHKYCVAPPSIHPSGAVLSWLEREGDLPPQVSLATLDFLPLNLASRKGGGALPNTAQRVLVQRDITRYDSNSEAELGAAMSLIRRGMTDDEVCAEFARHRPRHYASRTKPEEWLRRYCLPKAHEFVEEGPLQNAPRAASNLPAALAAVCQWASSAPWKGRTAETDKAVFLAHCRRAERDGVTPYRASMREVSELANVNKETACNATHRLENAGLIRRAGQDEISSAYSYVIPMVEQSEEAKVNPNPYTTTTGGGYLPCVRSSYTSDLWHTCAIGKSAYSVWQALLREGELTPAALAAATGRCSQTVSRALKRLGECQLVTRIGRVWIGHEASAETLAAIAAERGAAGRVARRQGRHAGERAGRASRIIMRQKEAWLQRQVSRVETGQAADAPAPR